MLINRLVYLARDDGSKPIPLEINSPGGAAGETMQILRAMDGVSSAVATFCRGEVRGTAVLIAAHGARGFRSATDDCRFSLAPDPASESSAALSEDLVRILLADAGAGQDQVRRWLETGEEFSAEGARGAGLTDVISPKPVFPRPAGG